MKKHKLWTVFFASCCFLVLVFDSKTAINGAISGIEICIKTVIPSLFPFFVLSIFLTSSLSGTDLKLLRPIGKLFRIPRGAEAILLSAFLGGYPAGAQSIASAYKRKDLSDSDARRMLTYCNNAGPAFLFGMIAPLFSEKATVWLLWGIHIAGALFISFFSEQANTQVYAPSEHPPQASDVMLSSVKAMAVVCGWILIFRILLFFLFRWVLWIFPSEVQILITGVLELSNGCLLLGQIRDSSLRFVMASGLLSFGGLCVTMQTRSVAGNLFGGNYIKAKLMQTAVSILLAAAIAYPKWSILSLLTAFFLLLLYKFRKNSSIPEPSVV